MFSSFAKLLTVQARQRLRKAVFFPVLPAVCGLLMWALILTGCGGGAPADPPAGAPNVTVLMQDAPSPGIAEFDIDVTGASLQGAGGQSLVLGGAPETLEFRHLGLAPTVALNASTAQTGTYNALLLSFANPRLTIVNSQGKVIRVTAQGSPSARLASGSVRLPLATTVGSSDHIAVQLDFDLQHSLSTDASGNYVITPVVQANLLGRSVSTGLQGELAMVSALFFNGPNLLSQVPINAVGQGGTNQQVFQVQLLDSQQTVPVKIDSHTILDPAIGQFSKLRLGQFIYLSADFQNDGTFLAKSIAAGPSNQQRYQGLVTGVHQDSSGQSSFDVVVQN